MPSFRGPVAALIVAPLLTIVTYSSAVKSAAGEVVEPTGRYQAVKQLLVDVGEYLGPAGTLAVGAVATALAAIWLIRTVQLHQRATTGSENVEPPE